MMKEPRIWRVFPEIKAEITKLLKMGYTGYQLENELGINNAVIRAWMKSRASAEMTYRDDPKFISQKESMMHRIKELKSLDVAKYQNESEEEFKQRLNEARKRIKNRNRKDRLFELEDYDMEGNPVKSTASSQQMPELPRIETSRYFLSRS